MPRPRKTIPTIRRGIALPADLVAQVDLLLYSDLEGRVPYGAWSELLEPILRRHVAACHAAQDGLSAPKL